MAFTARAAQQDGWENPARYLAFVPPVEVASELIDLKEQVTIKTTAAQLLNKPVRQLLAEAAAKDERRAELEDELRVGREDLDHSDNENRSLRTSLDLVTAENARLSERLTESAVETDALRARLENSKTALLAAEAEHDRLAVAIREAQSKIEGQNLELQSRQAGLLDAGETIESLTARVAQAEANSVLAQSKIKSLNVKLQNEQASCVAAKLARNKAQADCGRLRRELDSIAKPSETPLEPVAVGSATSLLAATFSF